MIFDAEENADRYLPLQEGFAAALRFLRRPDLKGLPVGRYDIDGDGIYALVSKGPGRAKEEALLETHEKYIDIQYVLAGIDTMGWKSRSLCRLSTGDYDQAADVQFFADIPDTWFCATPGTFAIFFPEDAHMPLISAGQIHKVVIKVKVDTT